MFVAAVVGFKPKTKKNMATQEKTTSSLPPEIVEIILSKLPSVKSLLRFKTVCKSWNTIISNPVFALIHMKSSNSSSNLFLCMYRDISEEGFSLVKLEGGRIRNEAVLKVHYGSFNQVLGECNGVLLLNENLHARKQYAFWNPSTRRQAHFSSPYVCDEFDPFTHGICYDPITDDFKAVMIAKESYRIYSYKNNSWTEKKGIGQFYFCMVGWGVFVDGAIYWVLDELNNNSLIQLVYFDPRTDELKVLQKPKELIGGIDEVIMKVASLRDNSLCLYFNTIDDWTRIRFLIKEKGVLENPNWKEFVVIENVVDAPTLWSQLLHFVENKIVIKIDGKKYLYYNPREKTIEEVEERDEMWDDFVPYLKTLLFPARVSGGK